MPAATRTAKYMGSDCIILTRFDIPPVYIEYPTKTATDAINPVYFPYPISQLEVTRFQSP